MMQAVCPRCYPADGSIHNHVLENHDYFNLRDKIIVFLKSAESDPDYYKSSSLIPELRRMLEEK